MAMLVQEKQKKRNTRYAWWWKLYIIRCILYKCISILGIKIVHNTSVDAISSFFFSNPKLKLALLLPMVYNIAKREGIFFFFIRYSLYLAHFSFASRDNVRFCVSSLCLFYSNFFFCPFLFFSLFRRAKKKSKGKKIVYVYIIRFPREGSLLRSLKRERHRVCFVRDFLIKHHAERTKWRIFTVLFWLSFVRTVK